MGERALLAGGGFITLGKLGHKEATVARSTSTKSVRSLPRIALSPALRRRMTGKRSVRSLPDAACLIGLTSQLDEAMEDMIMGTVGPEKQGPWCELNSDTDSDDEDDTDDEEDLSEIVADRLAHQYEAAVEEVLAMAMRNPGENGEVLKELLFYRGAGGTLDAEAGRPAQHGS